MKILVIDDDLEIRTVASVIMTKVGNHEVVQARSGTEGMKKARSEVPDAILLDVRMPDMQGPEVLAQLKADPQTKSIPVIFLTAQSDSASLERLSALPVKGIISKPFNPLTLHRELEAML